MKDKNYVSEDPDHLAVPFYNLKQSPLKKSESSADQKSANQLLFPTPKELAVLWSEETSKEAKADKKSSNYFMTEADYQAALKDPVAKPSIYDYRTFYKDQKTVESVWVDERLAEARKKFLQ